MVKTYNSKQVIATWGTIQLTDGALSEGTFLELNPTARRASQTGLMGGGAVIAIMSNTTGTITATVSASADINDLLTAQLQNQINTGIPRIGAFLVKDHSGRSLASESHALIDGFPPMTYAGDGTPTYQWVFLCPNLRMEPHGSNDA